MNSHLARIATTTAVVGTFLGMAPPATAALVPYADRPTWLGAVGPLSGTENFNGFLTDTSFVLGPVAANNMTLTGSAGSNPATVTQIVDVPPLSFPGYMPNGTAAMLNDLIDGSLSRIGFDTGVTAWGADFVGISDNGRQSKITLYDADDNILGVITPATTWDLDPYIARFIGFALTEGEVADHLVFAFESETSNDVFAVDDIGFVTNNKVSNSVPEPGSLALAGLGVALVGWRRRQAT